MIGIYAHHHGSGHMFRARALAARLRAAGERTTILSSHPDADVILPLDAPAPETSGADLTASGALHWVPRGHAGLRSRMAALAAWVAHRQPAAVHVDVSVEVAVLLRLLGVPVTTLAMPGKRSDPAHQLGYRVAEAIIAAWPDWVELPAHLQEHRAKVAAVGGISRFAEAGAPGLSGSGAPGGPDGLGGPVILLGQGGTDAEADYWQAVAAHLGPRCRVLGGSTWTADPSAVLARASVVISAAGQNSVADIAALRRPAVIVPQQRPFGEQHATAGVLRAAGLATVVEELPAPEAWAGIVAAAASQHPRWEEWQTDGAIDRAAACIRAIAARTPSDAPWQGPAARGLGEDTHLGGGATGVRT